MSNTTSTTQSWSFWVLASNSATRARLEGEIRRAAAMIPGVSLEVASGADTAHAWFFEPGNERLLDGLDRRGKGVFALVPADSFEVPAALASGLCDDVLASPVRPLELLSKLRYLQQLAMWEEVTSLNASFSELLGRLKEDFQLAERLQKARLPARFPDVKGFRIGNRYLAGMKSGGDHFDVAESKDGGVVSMVLSDSSSYRLSSAVLSVLMRVAMKLTTEETASSAATVRKIQDELMTVLGEKDRLSLFYGVISRRDLRFRYLNLGSSRGFYAPKGQGYALLDAQGEPLSKTASLELREEEVALEPESRLVLVSDGFIEAIGGTEEVRKLLDQHREREVADILNELGFRVKAELSEEDMPAQDCTAAVLDVDSRVIRLAR